MKASLFKRNTMALVCGAALLGLPAAAQSTTDPAPPPAQTDGPPPPGMGGPRGGPGRRVEMLQHELNLNQDQTSQVRAIMEAERTQSEALRSNSSLGPEERRSQMMAIRKQTNAKVKAILTPEQATKFDALQARMRERMQGRGGGDGPPPPPSL